MDKGRRFDLAKWATTFAIQKGASQVAVDLANQRVIDIQYRDGALEKLRESTSNPMSLDIYVEKRYSSHSTSTRNQMNILGNISDLLKRLVAAGNDPCPYSSVGIPSLRFEAVNSVESKEEGSWGPESRDLGS